MKRILILGGGFGGVYAALTLEKLLKAALNRVEVELSRPGGPRGAVLDLATRCAISSSG